MFFIDCKNLWGLLGFDLQGHSGARALQLDQAQRGPAYKIRFNRIAAQRRTKDGFQLPPVFFGHRCGVNNNLTAQTPKPQLTRQIAGHGDIGLKSGCGRAIFSRIHINCNKRAGWLN